MSDRCMEMLDAPRELVEPPHLDADDLDRVETRPSHPELDDLVDAIQELGRNVARMSVALLVIMMTVFLKSTVRPWPW